MSDGCKSPYGCRRSWDWEPHGTIPKAAGTDWRQQRDAEIDRLAAKYRAELLARGQSVGELPRCAGCGRETSAARSESLRRGWEVRDGTWVCPGCRPQGPTTEGGRPC